MKMSYLPRISFVVIIMLFTSVATAIPFTLQGTIGSFQDTGVDVAVGDTLNINASGQIFFANRSSGFTNPDGLGPELSNPTFFGGNLLPSAVNVSLVGKIGTSPVPESGPGLGAGSIGSNYSQVMTTAGRLFLAYNDGVGSFGDNSGFFDTEIEVSSSVPEPKTWIILLFTIPLLLCFHK